MARLSPARAGQLRAAVAQEAARLMAEHGITDYLTAKRKAAERYGVTDNALLPKNTEVEAALTSHQRLFGGERHVESLQRQRHVALQAMQLLSRFEPRLVGPVLAGTATDHTDIQLHLFTDDPEAVCLHLMDRRYEYEVLERRVKMQSDRQVTVPAVRFGMGDETIEATVFGRDGIRQAPLDPVDGRPMRRAGRDEVSQMATDAVQDRRDR